MQLLECIIKKKKKVLPHTIENAASIHRLTHAQGMCVKWRSAAVFPRHSAILAKYNYKNKYKQTWKNKLVFWGKMSLGLFYNAS